IENNLVAPANTVPYIHSINPEADKEFDSIFNKLSQTVDDRPAFALEHFINEIDLEHLQASNKELRNLKKIMQIPNFKFPNYLSHYNNIKNNLSIINNILYFTKKPYDPVPLLPTNSIISMALRIHDKYSQCGRDKLVDWIRTIAYHVKLSESLNKICIACPICLLKKYHPLRHTPPTIKIQTTYPYELVVGDLLSIPNWGRYKYIFLVVDHFSKRLAAWPLKDKSSQTVADALEKHILPTMIMPPKSFLSDNGLEFRGKPFQDMLRKYNIKPIHSASYHPEGHGAVERINRTEQQLLRLNAKETPNWPSILQHTVMCYNQSQHESLKTSPAEFLMQNPHETKKKPGLIVQDTQYWRVGNPAFKSYKRGTLVMKIIPRVGNRDVYKLQNLYNGPYVVLNIHQGGTSYSIRSIDDRMLLSNVHHSQLRLWISPDKVLLKSPDFYAYYNLCRPLTPLEANRYSEENDPVEERTFARDWKPSDETCEISADDLTDEFLGDREEQDSVQNNEQESEIDEEEAEEPRFSEPSPPQNYFFTVTPAPYQIPQNSSLGVPTPPPIQIPPSSSIETPLASTQPTWTYRNISSPINQNIQPPEQWPVKRPIQNNYNNPPNVLDQVYSPTPAYSSPPPPPQTPERNKITPSYLPHQILNTPSPHIPTSPQHNITPSPHHILSPPPLNITPSPQNIHTSPKSFHYTTPIKSPCSPPDLKTPIKSPQPLQYKYPDYTPALNELNRSPQTHYPPPQEYFNPNINPNFNNLIQDINRNNQNYTPPHRHPSYLDLLNQASPLKSPNFNSSPQHPITPKTEGLSADQALSSEPEPISISENELSAQPQPEIQQQPDERPKSKYQPSSPSIMKTRSQTRKENEL
ncbi:unnamed protein product, partial [Rotaria magnacalcarata]